MLIEEGLALESKWRGGKWLGTKRSPKQVSWLVCQDGELFYSTCWCACDSCNFGRRPQCIETSPFSGINTVCCDSCNISPGKCCIPCLCAKLFRFSAMFLLFVSSLFVAPETSWVLLKVPFCTASQSLLPDQSSHFLVVNCLSDPFIPLAFLSSVALAPGVAARLQCSVGVCQEGWNKMQLCNSYSQPSWFNASYRCTAGITSLPLGEWFWREKGMWTSCMCVCETMCYSQPWVSHTYACLYIYMCVHTGIYYQCLLSFEAWKVCKLKGNSLHVWAGTALRDFAVPPTFCCRLEERWDTLQYLWGDGLSPVLLGQGVSSPVLSFPGLRVSNPGCFEGEVPAESLMTRQMWAVIIKWNNFHLPCNCNDSQLVSWFKFCGFPLSLFLPSAFPTCFSCPSLSQSLSGLALCLPEKVTPYCAALWKAITLLRALPLHLWLQRGCCGIVYNFPRGRQDPGCLLSLHPFHAKGGVWVGFPASPLCLTFAQREKGCQFQNFLLPFLICPFKKRPWNKLTLEFPC